MTDLKIRSATVTTPDVETQVSIELDHGWSVVVWNDPINLMDYVVYVFQKVLHMNKSQATKHMMEVHQHGKSLVAHENKEKAEHLVHQLQAYGLKATLQAL
ncbi:MAG: ATP-dependent Clp protease adapter ClpS [Verrucomicrobiota bacterium]